jgi:hypothetical protein
MPLSDADRAEALARNERYVREMIEALNFCPYAKGSRLAGRSARVVCAESLAEDGTLILSEDARSALAALAAPDAEFEVVQVIYPRVRADYLAWDRAVKQATTAYFDEYGGAFAGVAPLHPNAEFTRHSPASLVPLFRRAPDPTIQWIALSALACVRGSRPHGEVLAPQDPVERAALLELLLKPSVSESIARANFERAEGEGIAALVALFAGLRSV